MERALYCIQTALCAKRVLYSTKRALYSTKRALYSIERALYSIKRALYSTKRALYHIEWRRRIGCLKLQVIFRKRSTNDRAFFAENDL